MRSDVVRKYVIPGEFVNKGPLLRPTTSAIRRRERAERFLEYFQHLPPNPGQSTLGIQALPTDWEVLSHLAMKFCSFARALDRPVHGHWKQRREHGKQLLRSLPRAKRRSREVYARAYLA